LPVGNYYLYIANRYPKVINYSGRISFTKNKGVIYKFMEYPSIAIIGGTGKEGMGLALRWAYAGLNIVIGSRQEARARLAADNINNKLSIKSVTGMENKAAVEKSEICVLTVVHSAHQQILESLLDVLQGKILVDATTRVDFQDPKPPDRPSAAEQAQVVLGPGVKVVSAFQNIPAKSLTKAVDQPVDADVMVCSDDISAAEQVINLANIAGLKAYYAGCLENSNVVEGLTSILIGLNKHYGVKNARIMVTGIPDPNSSDRQ
jgi:NADPH-dependent F420 reductase